MTDIDGFRLFVVHDIADLRSHPAPPGATMIVHGHSHKPAIVGRDGVTFVNPGSAGPRRFRLPVSIGEILVDGGVAAARFVTLGD